MEEEGKHPANDMDESDKYNGSGEYELRSTNPRVKPPI